MSTSKTFGRVLMISGACLLLFAYHFLSSNINESNQAASFSQEALMQIRTLSAFNPKPTITNEQTISSSSEEHPINIQMPVKHIDGADYVGIVKIPKLDISLPIINEWSEASLKKAPCRYAGSAYAGNLILCAHNYAHHFGRLEKLTIDDIIELEDFDGNQFTYQIIKFEQLKGHQVKEMLDGDWDLTLFTCVKGGQKRYTVRCKLISQNSDYH